MREVLRWGRQPAFDLPPGPTGSGRESREFWTWSAQRRSPARGFAVYGARAPRLERRWASFMLDVTTREHGLRRGDAAPAGDSACCSVPGSFSQIRGRISSSGRGERPFPDSYRRGAGTNLYRDEVLEEAQLPLSLVAYTPCFRSEAGSYGKDVRGIIRQHQFQKVELVKFARPEHSNEEHEQLTGHAEAFCGGWSCPIARCCSAPEIPARPRPRPTTSRSGFLGRGCTAKSLPAPTSKAYQARRANIRYKPQGRNKTELVHTLNGSGLAIGRTWVAVLENYQQSDGTVRVPRALVPYMGGEEIIRQR